MHREVLSPVGSGISDTGAVGELVSLRSPDHGSNSESSEKKPNRQIRELRAALSGAAFTASNGREFDVCGQLAMSGREFDVCDQLAMSGRESSRDARQYEACFEHCDFPDCTILELWKRTNKPQERLEPKPEIPTGQIRPKRTNVISKGKK
jgi:hypothetical protein